MRDKRLKEKHDSEAAEDLDAQHFVVVFDKIKEGTQFMRYGVYDTRIEFNVKADTAQDAITIAEKKFSELVSSPLAAIITRQNFKLTRVEAC